MDPIIVSALQQQQQQIAIQTQMSVLKKTQDVQKQLGEAIVGMIQGVSIQVPGKAIGSGMNFDAYA